MGQARRDFEPASARTLQSPTQHPEFSVRLSARLRLVLMAVVVATASLPVLLPVVGFRPLIVRSGSMAPTVLTGDVIVTRFVKPSSVRVGDIVTFSDRGRSEELVTHRAVKIVPQGRTYSFTTQGDSNSGTEEWTIDHHGRVGLLVLRVPKLGFPVSLISGPAARATLVVLSLVLLVTAGLRRIWQ